MYLCRYVDICNYQLMQLKPEITTILISLQCCYCLLQKEIIVIYVIFLLRVGEVLTYDLSTLEHYSNLHKRSNKAYQQVSKKPCFSAYVSRIYDKIHLSFYYNNNKRNAVCVIKNRRRCCYSCKNMALLT